MVGGVLVRATALLLGVLVARASAATQHDWRGATLSVGAVTVHACWDGTVEANRTSGGTSALLWRTELPLAVTLPNCATAAPCSPGRACVEPHIDTSQTQASIVGAALRGTAGIGAGFLAVERGHTRPLAVLAVDVDTGHITPLQIDHHYQQQQEVHKSTTITITVNENLLSARTLAAEEIWNCTFPSITLSYPHTNRDKGNSISSRSNKDQQAQQRSKPLWNHPTFNAAAALVAGVLVGGAATSCVLVLVCASSALPSRMEHDLTARAAVARVAEAKEHGAVSQPAVNSDGSVAVGMISMYPSEPLGTVARGVELYRGVLDDGRAVTVKRVDRAVRGATTERELELMVAMEMPRNVVSYYALERDADHLYLALTPCTCTLDAWVAWRMKRAAATHRLSLTFNLICTMHGIARGLQWLHRNGIVYGDVAPNKILIDSQGNPRLCDLALAKYAATPSQQLYQQQAQKQDKEGDEDEQEFGGTRGWAAPEVLVQGRRAVSAASDVFSLGCLYQYMTSGEHPFGSTAEEREATMLHGEPDYAQLAAYPRLLHLVQMATRKDPAQRALMSDVINHILFWPRKKYIDFACTVFDRLNSEPEGSPVKQQLEAYLSQLPELHNWRERVPPCLFEDRTNKRVVAYTTHSDVLRLIRNKACHYRDLDRRERAVLGSYPDGMYHFFDTRFPSLFVCVYEFVLHTLSNEPCFNTTYF